MVLTAASVASLLEDAVVLVDYDGTIALFVSDPMKAFPAPLALRGVRALESIVKVVFITGRSVEVLCHLLNGGDTSSEELIRFPAYGEHGAQVQLDLSQAPRMVILSEGEKELLSEIQERSLEFMTALSRRVSERLGVSISESSFVEMKKLGVVLHWRFLVEKVLPELNLTEAEKDQVVEDFSEDIKSFFEELLRDTRNFSSEKTYFSLLLNHMNYEVRHISCNKGEAVANIMAHYPGKKPIFLCDDLKGTDGDGARMVHKLGGTVITVSHGHTDLPTDDRAPDFVVSTPEELGAFLLEVAQLTQ